MSTSTPVRSVLAPSTFPVSSPYQLDFSHSICARTNSRPPSHQPCSSSTEPASATVRIPNQQPSTLAQYVCCRNRRTSPVAFPTSVRSGPRIRSAYS
ncbi:unnamed protein product [Chondrus crispus]|uniref:Uncharacterized protein n=1 Tax=Chondrus crispus TaxID=2769 RepID=R7QE77_CHOCR|nr:unnamed protein product [Chondrus crispus]CDF36048.1 unnamed protein product [Chondrus crispus]|eukprot:XP_005715867.1 unnamed protein product [Chondrus crispus]